MFYNFSSHITELVVFHDALMRFKLAQVDCRYAVYTCVGKFQKLCRVIRTLDVVTPPLCCRSEANTELLPL